MSKVLKYRKKPIVIEARRLTSKSLESVMKWCDGELWTNDSEREVAGIEIDTLEGIMIAQFGDYIIKGIQGEFYPCKPDIFKKTYDKVKGGE